MLVRGQPGRFGLLFAPAQEATEPVSQREQPCVVLVGQSHLDADTIVSRCVIAFRPTSARPLTWAAGPAADMTEPNPAGGGRGFHGEAAPGEAQADGRPAAEVEIAVVGDSFVGDEHEPTRWWGSIIALAGRQSGRSAISPPRRPSSASCPWRSSSAGWGRGSPGAVGHDRVLHQSLLLPAAQRDAGLPGRQHVGCCGVGDPGGRGLIVG